MVVSMYCQLEELFIEKFKNLKIEGKQFGENQSCEFMKGTGKNIVRCGRKSQFQFENKWYCGKQKSNGDYCMHMGTITKSLNKKKTNKITKAMSKKIADESTQELIDQVTHATLIEPRRAWKGGPYVYRNDVVGAPALVINPDTQTVEGILVNKETLPLNAEAIKMCRSYKLAYELGDDEDDIIEENISENESEEEEDETLETSEEEEEEDDDDDDDENEDEDNEED